jgi:hypothetical protein
MNLLKQEDKDWIALHTSLAKETDFETFSALLLGKKKPKKHTEVYYDTRREEYVNSKREWRKVEADRQLSVFLESCRQAVPSDLQKWLRGYRLNGGVVTRTVEGAMPADWYFLYEEPSVKLPELYGANSVTVVVDEYISPKYFITENFHDYGKSLFNRGHNEIYFMDNFKFVGNYGPLSFDEDAV